MILQQIFQTQSRFWKLYSNSSYSKTHTVLKLKTIVLNFCSVFLNEIYILQCEMLVLKWSI